MRKYLKINRLFTLILVFSSICSFAQKSEIPPYAEDYSIITKDGAWCWFSDPRAIYINQVIFGGYVDKEGSIFAFSYDPKTQKRNDHKLFDKLNVDDHANPSFMKLPDNRLVIFFSGHGGSTNTPIYYAVTKRPADISEWDKLQSVSPKIEGPMGYCYTNPVMLSSEKNKIFLFFRGSNFKPNFITTTDLKSWEEPKTFVKDDTTQGFVRPYMKVASNGKDKIFFAFTDDHPRNRATNSIYFMTYKGGKFLSADGKEIKDAKSGAVAPRNADIVYDATKTFEKAWIWDVAYDKNENPVIVYARFSSIAGEHSYWYAKWDGQKWTNKLITKAGTWFQRNNYTKSKLEYEVNYSGGVYLDHENTDIVYTSRPIDDVFEIEQWTLDNNGKKWSTKAITQHSEKDNVRPFVVRGHQGEEASVLWMYNYDYPNFRNYRSAIRINQKAGGMSARFNKEDVLAVAKKVADWQMNSFPKNQVSDHRGWVAGTFYNGLMDMAEMSQDEIYYKWLKDVFSKQSWQVGNRMYHADDICVAQSYLDMYAKFKEPIMLQGTKARVDWVMANPSESGMELNGSKPISSQRWSWCDALFMAPSVYTRMYSLTGNKAYAEFADKEFKATYNLLYDKGEHLFFRDKRYLDKKEANGKKVFWGRGNGWVMGGMVEMLKTLPSGDKQYKPYYENLFKEMSAKIVTLQGHDGFWRASLLDPDSYPSPETSSTGFFVYALAYGVNNGYLSKDQYLPIIKKGWQALVSSVNTEGKLGWVQPIGEDPRNVTKNMTTLYGPGAFLMAASEIYKLSK
ncbi:glycoside hydrolase family 88 protein [Pedobacter sp. MW01-1-1]|uniref:glycoside hydrolase family 88 protein n=1 Tax=Pedobacter sp. MW01-1-1 TaxID=3383027 RepID=UPI003FEDF676